MSIRALCFKESNCILLRRCTILSKICRYVTQQKACIRCNFTGSANSFIKPDSKDNMEPQCPKRILQIFIDKAQIFQRGGCCSGGRASRLVIGVWIRPPPLICIFKCAWARYWTPNCSWWAVGTLHGSLRHQCMDVCVKCVVKRFEQSVE